MTHVFRLRARFTCELCAVMLVFSQNQMIVSSVADACVHINVTSHVHGKTDHDHRGIRKCSDLALVALTTSRERSTALVDLRGARQCKEAGASSGGVRAHKPRRPGVRPGCLRTRAMMTATALANCLGRAP